MMENIDFPLPLSLNCKPLEDNEDIYFGFVLPAFVLLPTI